MSGRALRYLALGDSYTIGEGVSPEARWPSQLVRALRAAGQAIEDPCCLAATGWSSDELAAAIEATPLQGPWDLVSLQIGVNDQYRGYPASARREGIRQLLQRAGSLAGDRRRVLAVSMPDWSVTPFAAASGRDLAEMAAQVDAYNRMMHQLAGEAGIAWVDVTAASRAQPDRLAADGLHPGPEQYASWSALALPAVRRLLLDAGIG